VVLAGASEYTIIVGFHVKPTQSVKQKAKELGVEIRTYDIIYDLLEDVKKTLGTMLSPVYEMEKIGKAEVRDIFKVPKLGTIAGCMIIDGSVLKDAMANIYRGEDLIYSGKIVSLKRFKDDVKEVKKGFECGIGIENFEDMKPGDMIEVQKEVQKQAEFKH
jgi:translation initiation factor IF-2